MKILFVLEHYAPYLGGAETLFRALTEALAERGHDITVLTTRFRPDLPARETVAGVRIHRIDCRNRFLFSLFALPEALRLAATADLVHTTTYNAALPAWLGAQLRGKRVVITFHEYWGKLWMDLPFLPRWQALLFRAYERLILALPFDRYVAVSDFTARALVQGGVEEAKVVRIYNGLAYERFSGSEHRPPPRFTYTFFGRLGVSKGLDLLLPAAAELRKIHPDARLRLVIPRRPRAFLERILRLVETTGIGDITEIHHELPDGELRELLLTSSCIVIPSYSEGFCFAAAEAVALGVPVVSSGQGALAETVGGKYVEMETMTSRGLADALAKAASGHYNFRPLPHFPLMGSVEQYLLLYGNFIS